MTIGINAVLNSFLYNGEYASQESEVSTIDAPSPQQENESDRRRWGDTIIPVTIIVISLLLAYSNSYSGPFVFDDIVTIVESRSIRKLWPVTSVLFNAGASAAGRPLVNLSFALNYAFGGLKVTSYHVVNVTIHLLAGITLFGLVRQTFLCQQ